MANGNTHRPKAEPNTGGRDSTKRRGYDNRPRSSIAWDEIPQDNIGTLVHTVCSQGAAIMFGRTSDGGALSITILDGEERIREWPHTAEEFEAFAGWCQANFLTL